MPELTFTVRWPDGTVEDCWSPSLVLHDHLEAGATYPVAEFTRRSVAGLQSASERVQAAYGFPCSLAAASMVAIRSRAAMFRPQDPVAVLRLHPPLPAPSPQEQW